MKQRLPISTSHRFRATSSASDGGRARCLAALFAAVALLAGGRADAQGPLRQTVGRDGVVRLTNDGAATRCEPPTCQQWVDSDGAVHLTLRGPSAKARARAAQVTVRPRSGRGPARVHETATFDEAIQEAAEKYQIPHALVRAIIVAESNFDPAAVSPKGARGLMQLMPGTAGEMYVSDAHDPAQNIHGGTRYLRILANQFGGDFVKTIAAYNAGPEAVKRAGGVPNYAETREYVRKVVRLYNIYKGS